MNAGELPTTASPPHDSSDDAEELARGVAAVDKAVRRRRRIESGEDIAIFRVAGKAAAELGWAICQCGRGIEPGGGVVYKGALFHPECVALRLEIAA